MVLANTLQEKQTRNVSVVMNMWNGFKEVTLQPCEQLIPFKNEIQ
jgi:hypothetical protein